MAVEEEPLRYITLCDGKKTSMDCLEALVVSDALLPINGNAVTLNVSEKKPTRISSSGDLWYCSKEYEEGKEDEKITYAIGFYKMTESNWVVCE